MERKKVLIITYYWYPFAGVGLYRISRFAKYLKRAGWDVVILTAKKAASGMQAEPDDPLLENIKVHRAGIIEPTGLLNSKKGASTTSNPSVFYQKNASWKVRLAVWIRLNLMIPDAKFTWKWFAVPLGKKIIKKEKPDLILSTSPPPTTNLVAKKLAEWSGLPWVADFRDPWTNIYYYDDSPQSQRARKKNKQLEAEVLKSADKITLVNKGFFPEHEEEMAYKTTVISNGYDPDDIIKVEDACSTNKKFTIRYFGSMKINQYPTAFIEALKILGKHHTDIAKSIHFDFFGNIDTQIKNDISNTSDYIETVFHEYIPHTEMMKLVSSSDLLLVTIGRSKNSKYGLSTKVFEYMISGNPVLGIGPVDGAAADIVHETNIGRFFDHEDAEGVKNYILDLFKASQEGIKRYKENEVAIKNFSFKQLTNQLLQIVDEVTTQ